MKVGFIGLGVMGKRIALNVLKGGFSINVYDLVTEAAQALEGHGAKLFSSSAEVARESDIVLTSLPNEKVVREVITGPGGVLEGSAEGAIIVDLSSITPGVINAIGRDAAAKKVTVLDAPVSGGSVGAEKGTLTIMIGGEDEAVEKVRPVLNTFSKKIFHVGKLGAGDTAKLVNNLLLGANMAAASEALTLGIKAGLEPDVLFELISQSSGSSYALEAKYPGFIAQNNFTPGFTVDLQYKDLELAISMAKELNVPLLLGVLAQQVYQIARSTGLGPEDISSVIKVYEQLAASSVSRSDGIERADSNES